MADLRLGILGISEGNGHPFSFASIINGYSAPDLASAGWSVIYDYVRRRDPADFGICGAYITHAWTQDPQTTRKLCAAARIPNSVATPEALIGAVDAVIIARDDYENHLQLAVPFLEAGLPVFVDKPLTLSADELARFYPYLRSGRLMSCSAMRYARELDEAKANLESYGDLKLVRGAVVNGWEKYGVHLLEAITALIGPRFEWVQAADSKHMSATIGTAGGPLVQIDALGSTVVGFQLDLWGNASASSHRISDNFSMFRRMLWHFVESVKTQKPAIAPEETIAIMKVLMAGRISGAENRRVNLNELTLTV